MVPISPYKWAVHPGSPLAYAPWFVVAGALAFFWSRRATWGRHVLLGCGFFLLNLLPFLGLNSVTYMGYTWVMDHFLYIPIIGLIGLVIAALGDLEDRFFIRAKSWLAGFIAVIFAALALESESVAAVFIGPETLWTCILAHNPDSWLAHNNLGDVYLATGRTPAAITEFQQALALNPYSVDAHTNLGFAYELTHRPKEALEEYEATLQINPHYGITQFHLGHLLETTGDIPGAISHYQEALRINPRDEGSREGLARLQNRKPGAE
jgi:tetratricopeptide (TPR) repeat protein